MGDLLKTTFKKFDTDNSGFITVENLREVLGDTFDGAKVNELLAEGDILKDGRISFAEFVAYLRGTPLEAHTEAVSQVLELQRDRVLSGEVSNCSQNHRDVIDAKFKGVKVKDGTQSGDKGAATGTASGEESKPKCCA